MKTKLALVLLMIAGFRAFAQEAAPPQMTDKNYQERYAAYVLQRSYHEFGYMAARVDLKKTGESDVFVVDRGPLYHFKEIVISGLPESDVKTALQDAPKPGDVFSRARMNQWLAQLRNKYEAGAGPKWKQTTVRLDRANAQATLTVTFE